MTKKIIIFLFGVVFSAVLSAYIALHIPLSWFETEQEPQFGSTITTILGTDTLTNSRTTINNNFSALNTSKAEISDVSGTTTLSSLASVGTITTGVWNATPIPAAFGGTGWGSIASGTVMYGKGTASFATTTSGTDGQVLALVGGTPTWQSSSVDATLAYTWTGLHKFTAGFISSASSTHTSTLNIGGTVNWGAFTAVSPKFGGTGSDGALSLSSGTTTINLGSASVVVKNYTSISITGTGHLAFSNPASGGTVVILKSQGNVTMTNSGISVDVSSLGAAGGNGCTSSGSACSGSPGTAGTSFYIFPTNFGVNGTSAGGAGAGGALPTTIAPSSWANSSVAKYGGNLFVGAGGGGGGNQFTSGTAGAGGRGGGALLIEVGGDANITGIILANGANGSDASGGNGGGGGGGGGGLIKIIYNTVTSVAGTFTVNGGTGGTGASGTQSGGGGGSAYNAGTSGGANGGTGGNGYSSTEANTDFF